MMIAGAGDLAGRLQHLEDLRLDGHVQRGGRLVRDDQVRVVGDRDRDHRALAHAAGELVRERRRALLRVGDADELQQLDRARLSAASRVTSLWIRIASAIWSPTV